MRLVAAYRVRPGDCLASIALEHGVTWRSIWDHPDNAELRRRRSPHVLFEGDLVTVPERPEPREVEVATDRRHRFVVRADQVRLKLTLKGLRGETLASRAFELRVAGQTRTGTTDGDGKLDVAVPAGAREAELRVTLDGGRTLEVPLALGHLDPVEEASGLRQRLRNLGYLRKRGAGAEAVEDALRRFQADNGLSATGASDEASCARLREKHGS